MRIQICAVGRLRTGPELSLIEDYLTRFGRTGRAIGLGPASVQEVDERKARTMDAQADALGRTIPSDAWICCLDERGKALSSPDFAKVLQAQAERGVSVGCFVIGGADGLDKSLRQRADTSLSFGNMVWPHMLVRVMLAEQLYRAATILTGGPYHRA
ncbi:MAG: 23S rRNA (pseudouridine(1915)-N(3))-methyltransferase RlmH [Paracoccaceae bacterium]